jgi:hypothetical protein
MIRVHISSDLIACLDWSETLVNWALGLAPSCTAKANAVIFWTITIIGLFKITLLQNQESQHSQRKGQTKNGN